MLTSLADTSASAADFLGDLRPRYASVATALRRLRDLGLVAPSRGVGTRVVGSRPRSNYVLAARSVAEVMGYADRTRLEIDRRETVRAGATLALAISCVDLYIAAEFAGIVENADLVTTPAYRLIGQRLGIGVAEIRQDIAAVAFTRAQASVLGSRAGRWKRPWCSTVWAGWGIR
jgi:DNA-binding GntR family transcriptional regulator